MLTASRRNKVKPVLSRVRPSEPVEIPARSMVDFQWYAQEILCTEKGERLDFENRPYLKEIYDCPDLEMVVEKAAQVGLSGWGVNKCLWLADQYRLVLIYVLPTREDVTAFSQTRFNPIAQRAKIESRMEVDNVGIKQVGDSFIHFRGTWKETEAMSVAADAVFIDEFDKCKQDTAEAYRERISASTLGMMAWLSTPTYQNYGIDAKWKMSDMREWHVACKCGLEQVLTLDHIHYEENAYRCEKCKAPLDNRRGRWIPTGKGRLVGFHPTQLIAPWIEPRRIIDKRNDPKMTRKDFSNLVLGEPYAGGNTRVTRAHIIACIRDNMSQKGRACIGVDWGETTWFAVRKPGRLVHYGKIEGDTRTHAAQILELRDKFRDSWIIADHGYGDTKNIELIENSPHGTAWMCIYANNGKDMEPRYVEKDHTVHVDRTTSLTLCMEDLQLGRVEIAQNELQETLIQHYTNLFEKKEPGADGIMRTSIERGGPDHLAHADNYASLPERGPDTGSGKVYVYNVSPQEDDDDQD